MKKLIPFALVTAIAFPLFAQEAEKDVKNEAAVPKEEMKADSKIWPAYFAVGEFPRSADVVGVRLTIPYSTVQENVTGIDIGFWGHSLYFEGLQFNLIRNDAVDSMSGFQAGIYNSVGCGNMLGVQAGLWNEALSFCGVQVGAINIVGEGSGLQVGIINRAETFYGYQIGLINVIRDAELQFMPIINIGF